MKLSEADLQRIKDAALVIFKSKHNNCIASDLAPLGAYLEAFSDFCTRSGAPINLELPSRRAYESVDED